MENQARVMQLISCFINNVCNLFPNPPHAILWGIEPSVISIPGVGLPLFMQYRRVQHSITVHSVHCYNAPTAIGGSLPHQEAINEVVQSNTSCAPPQPANEVKDKTYM